MAKKEDVYELLNKQFVSFLTWYGEGTKNYFEELKIAKFIRKMAKWYETKYPNDSLSKDDFSVKSSIADFTRNLSYEELEYLKAPRYPGILSLSNDEAAVLKQPLFYLSKSGMKMADNVVKRTSTGLGYRDMNMSSLFAGRHITEASDIALDNAISMNFAKIDDAISKYEEDFHFYNGLLNCVMCQIVSDNLDDNGIKRAQLFSLEFGTDLDVLDECGIDISVKIPGMTISENDINKGKSLVYKSGN